MTTDKTTKFEGQPTAAEADMGHNKGISAQRLKSFIQRIERLDEEKKTLATDRKEVFSEAKAGGFDTKIINMVLKIRKIDKADRAEQEALLQIYLDAVES